MPRATRLGTDWLQPRWSCGQFPFGHPSLGIFLLVISFSLDRKRNNVILNMPTLEAIRNSACVFGTVAQSPGHIWLTARVPGRTPKPATRPYPWDRLTHTSLRERKLLCVPCRLRCRQSFGRIGKNTRFCSRSPCRCFS